MRVRAFLVTMVVAAGLVVVGTPAEAGAPVNVITATGVGLDDSSDCGPGSDLFIEGTATGSNGGGGDAQERGTGSTLTEPDIGSFEQPSTGYPAGDFAFDYGINNDDRPEGTVIGLYAAVGDQNEDPQTFGEWIIVYRCASDAANSELLYSCFGPLNSCPMTAGAAQEEAFTVEVSNANPVAGETLTVVGSECFGDAGSLRLVDGATVLDESDGIPVDADGTIVADLTVPANIAPGTELEVLGECYLEDTLIGDDGVAVTVAEPVTTTTVPPTTVRPATPAARPVALTPAFTG
jgi:hypothetical protein